ncbi:inversin-like [Mercenaria mercenaria]|uniref:inversin-like n=1 Tax=Mercenaria mercenaria TaxID=6596 RepID=UPI00234EE6C8|nr:inversin-like [Mercenaria mercenaria]
MRQLSPSTSPVLGHGEFSGGKDLNECVYKNDIDGAKACLHDNKMAWNTRNESGLTPLMEASTLSRLEILTLLLSSKCDVNVTDENGNTSLHLAVDEGNTEVVRKLIHSGRCIVDAKNANGETALMKAAFYDYSEMVRIMLTDGDADPNARDKTGQTALHIALREGSHMTVDLLLKHGCDVSVLDNLGQSALYVAIHSPCNKTLDLAKKLISAGYEISADKLWLLNDEKHNLFYQDDEFYVTLRKTLRKNSNEVLQDFNTYRKISTGSNKIDTNYSVSPIHSPVLSPKQLSPTTPPFPMSPSLKQKIMSSQTPKYPSVPFSQMSLNESNSVWLSPSCARRNEFIKSNSFEQVKPKTPLRPPLTSSFSSDSDDSPMGSPALRRRTLLLNTKVTGKSNDTHITSLLVSSTKEEPAVVEKDGRSVTVSFANKKPVYLRSEDEIPRSAPNSPMIRCRRHMSARQPRSGSHENVNQRKISLPAKTAVKFSTEIQVIEYNRRQ